MQKLPPYPQKLRLVGRDTEGVQKDERFFCIVDVSVLCPVVLPFFHIRETCGQGSIRGESLGKRGMGVWGGETFFRKVFPFPNLHTKQSNAN